MDKKQLREWVGAWADRYPVQDDEPLATFAGRESLDRDAMAVMVRWKFNNMAHRKANATRYLDKEPDGRIEDLTRRAFACSDDLGALLIVDVLRGVGPALGSSILMASDPERTRSWTFGPSGPFANWVCSPPDGRTPASASGWTTSEPVES